MFRYKIQQNINDRLKEDYVYSNTKHTKAEFKSIIKSAISDLKDAKIWLNQSNSMKLIINELVNNYNFSYCVDTAIYNISELI